MNIDDPKFTAHAIGELEDLTPAERAEIEALIQADPSAATEAGETRKIAALLHREFQGEEAEPLTAPQRAAVLAARNSSATPRPAKVYSFPRRITILSAIAACLIVGVSIALLLPLMLAERDGARYTAGIGITEQQEVAVPQDEPSEPSLEPPAPSDRNMIAAGTPSPLGNHSVDGLPSPDMTVLHSPAPPIHPPSFGKNEAMQRSSGSAMGGRSGNRMLALNKPLPSKRGGNDPYERFLNTDSYDRRRLIEDGDGTPFDPTDPANTRSFDAINDNAFVGVREHPLSTFSIDVDTASYALVRRFLTQHQPPPPDAVRIEEMLNYFTYDYPQPRGDAPFSATMEVAACPWTPEHRLVRIGLKGREIARDRRPASNLVFLIDVSGSMQPENKLPLLKESLGLLIDQLGEEDRVAMVVYAGNSGCVLQPTHDKAKMRRALAKLEAGGSTNGASGIQLAYQLAESGFIKGGTNRVILATDGDWNVGITNESDLLAMIAKKAKGGVFLTVLGVGMDNLKDSMLVKLADKGNGNYAYLDTLIEAKKVLVDQLSSTLVTIAKDVKIQVEFNPAQVGAYRLIGYEKRLLAKEDFNDDKKDAGEIGAGHTVTALYEVVPAGKEVQGHATVDPLKYQAPAEKPAEPAPKPAAGETGKEMLTLKLRYKAPDGDTSKLLEFPLTDTGASWEKSSRDFRFAAAVAGYGMLLRGSPHKGGATWNSIRELAVEGKGEDASGYRMEFLSLLEKARALVR